MWQKENFCYKRNCTAAWYFWMSNVQSGKDHSFSLQQSVFLHSQIQPIRAQTEVWDKHPPHTLNASVSFTDFLLKKGHFQSPPKWAEAGAKARGGLIIPLGQSVSNHVVQAPKRIEREGLGKRSTERAIRAQLFEGRLALDLGLDLTHFSFAQRHFLG